MKPSETSVDGRNAHKSSGSTTRLAVKAAAIYVLVALVLAGALAGGWHLLTRRSRAIVAVTAEVQERGLPVTMEEYLQRRGKVPDDENGGPVFEDAIYVCKSVPTPSPGIPLVSRPKTSLPLPNGPASPGTIKAVREFLASQAKLIEILHEGAQFPRCRYNVDWQDGFFTLLPHLTYVRMCTRRLALAAWLDAVDDRPEEAVGKVRDALILARSLRDEPCLVSLRVRLVCDTIATRTALAQVLTRTDPSPEALEALQRDLESEAAGLCAADACQAVIIDLLALYDHTHAGDDDELRSLLDFTSVSSWNSDLRRAKRHLGRDVALGVRYMLDFTTMAENPSPEVIRHLTDPSFTKQLDDARLLVRKTSRESMLGSVAKSLYEVEQTRALLRSAASAVAAMRFRQARGRWPASLDALVPDYLAKVPVDPFSGAPLIYKILGDGIMVYSVGRNRTDDGGKPSLVKPADGDKGDYDDYNGFRIWEKPPESPAR